MTCCGSFCRHVLAITLTIISILSAPFAILLLPVYFLRYLVSRLSRLFRPDLGKMLSPRGNLFAAAEFSEMFTKRTRCVIYVTHIVNDSLNVEDFRQMVLKKVVKLQLNPEETDPTKIRYANPELQQTLTKWLGYIFWQWEKDFNIEDHINAYAGPGKVDLVSDDDISDIMKELSGRPFLPGKSPWEFWVWNNARMKRDAEGKRKGILVLRVHHSLCDGYSVLKILLEDIAGKKIATSCAQPKGVEVKEGGNSQGQSSTSGLLKKSFTALWFLMRAPYQMINLSIQSWDFNEWHIKEEDLSGRLNSAMTEPIPVDYIKEIKNMYGASFNAVLQAAFTGGIRNFMLERCVPVPQNLHCMTPLPMKGHPERLRNHMTAFIAPLPVGVEEPRDRMRSVDRSLKRLHSSTVPLATFYMLPFIGALPAWVIKILATNKISTCLMTNFPAPSHGVELLGNDVDDIMFGGGLLVGNIGIGVSSLSYNGGIRLGAGIDENLLADPEAVKSLVRKIEDELHILRGQEIV